jgi:predicted  nucleic acid-binding Zn-ribbon protein
MTTAESPDELRAELRDLDEQIDQLQRMVDDTRRELSETSDKTSAIEGAEQQEALIGQLQRRRRDLIDRIDDNTSSGS